MASVPLAVVNYSGSKIWGVAHWVKHAHARYSYPRGLTDVFGDLKFIGTMRTVIHTKHQYRTLFTCLLTHPQVKQEVVQIRLVHNSVFHQSAVSWLNSQNCIPSRSISSLHSDIKIANSSLKYFTTSDGIASPLLHTVSLKLALIPYLWQNWHLLCTCGSLCWCLLHWIKKQGYFK